MASDDLTSPRKQALREEVWASLERPYGRGPGGISDKPPARFPGAWGRIPNFTGAEAAAEALTELGAFRRARTLKCNPDSPQRRVRHLALKAGKTVLMAVPKLASRQPFLALDPEELGERALWKASSIKGASALGRPVGLEELGAVDLIVTGCVGAGRDGVRLGKGGGYSDLEYGVLREAGKVGARTPVVTTVHPLQVLERGAIPREPHDVTLDWIVTPEETIRCKGRPRRPRGVQWELLSDERIAAMPVLSDRRSGRP